MKTLILNGSPRKNGDTVSLLNEMKKHLKGEVIIISAYNDDINPCTDCRYCWTHKECIIKDDMQRVYELLNEVDNIVIASPVYFSQLTGELLNLASRFQLYYAIRRIQKDKTFSLKHKKGVLILVGGGDGSPEPAVDTANIFFRHLNAECIDTVMSLNTDKVSAKDDMDAIEGIRRAAERLNGKKNIIHKDKKRVIKNKLDFRLKHVFDRIVSLSELCEKTNNFDGVDKWSQITSCMDHITYAIRYINNIDWEKNTGTGLALELISLLTGGHMIKMASDILYKNISKCDEYPLLNDYSCFIKSRSGDKFYDSSDNCSDDTYFFSLRAIMFAHSTSIDSKRNIFHKGKIRYCSWVGWFSTEKKESIIMNIYSSVPNDKLEHIRIYTNEIFDYINKRYNLLGELITIIKNEYMDDERKRVVEKLENCKL